MYRQKKCGEENKFWHFETDKNCIVYTTTTPPYKKTKTKYTKKTPLNTHTSVCNAMTKEETNNDFFVSSKNKNKKSRNLKKNHLKLFSLKFISYLLSYIIYDRMHYFQWIKKKQSKKTYKLYSIRICCITSLKKQHTLLLLISRFFFGSKIEQKGLYIPLGGPIDLLHWL